jgi:hypothetical protein
MDKIGKSSFHLFIRIMRLMFLIALIDFTSVQQFGV